MRFEAGAVTIGDYRPQDSDEALAIERACPQGRTFQLTFRRPAFHRRADSFEQRRILAAHVGDRLAGVLAVAIKPVTLRGAPARAAFLFDLRVDPRLQRRGVAGGMLGEAMSWALPRADVVYLYTVAENDAVRRMGARFRGAREVGGYAYLVIPAAARRPRPGLASSFDEVHDAMRAVRPPFDFYTRPAPAEGYVGSWILRTERGAAGGSAWDHGHALAEAVERVPPLYRALSILDGTRPWRAAGWPKIPRPGEVVRSWRLFDFFASDAATARELVRHIAAEARARGVDYLYLVHRPGDPHVDAIRADQPRLLAPVVPYCMVACGASGTPLAPFVNPYVDVRDL